VVEGTLRFTPATLANEVIEGDFAASAHGSSWHLVHVRHRVLDVRFSNRPFEVKRFQTIHQHSVGIARGLALLFGLGT
jgi:hypothetical protein